MRVYIRVRKFARNLRKIWRQMTDHKGRRYMGGEQKRSHHGVLASNFK